ncbi:hypothetical protein BJX68DRAFT_111237 [Aspergillus pseudodeflectus]|uniref:Uncharacterized protein n=1 Tax=Aspergillus pseudodeflectus TaxID=176178 RepID=A0ABR4K693_9EURO
MKNKIRTLPAHHPTTCPSIVSAKFCRIPSHWHSLVLYSFYSFSFFCFWMKGPCPFFVFRISHYDMFEPDQRVPSLKARYISTVGEHQATLLNTRELVRCTKPCKRIDRFQSQIPGKGEIATIYVDTKEPIHPNGEPDLTRSRRRHGNTLKERVLELGRFLGILYGTDASSLHCNLTMSPLASSDQSASSRIRDSGASR